jgi:hypothetical protein
MIVGSKLGNFASGKPDLDGLAHDSEFLQDPGVQPILAERFLELSDTLQESAVFERAARFATAKTPAVRAVQNVYYIRAGDRSQHRCLETRLGRIFRLHQFEKIDLQPGAGVESYFEDDRLQNQGVERMGTDIAHAGCACVRVGVKRAGGEKAVVIAPGLEKAGAIDFPSSVAVGAMVKIDFVEVFIVVEPRRVAGEVCQRRRYLMIGIGTQKSILYIQIGAGPWFPLSFYLHFPYALYA